MPRTKVKNKWHYELHGDFCSKAKQQLLSIISSFLLSTNVFEPQLYAFSTKDPILKQFYICTSESYSLVDLQKIICISFTPLRLGLPLINIFTVLQHHISLYSDFALGAFYLQGICPKEQLNYVRAEGEVEWQLEQRSQGGEPNKRKSRCTQQKQRERTLIFSLFLTLPPWLSIKDISIKNLEQKQQRISVP